MIKYLQTGSWKLAQTLQFSKTCSGGCMVLIVLMGNDVFIPEKTQPQQPVLNK